MNKKGQEGWIFVGLLIVGVALLLLIILSPSSDSTGGAINKTTPNLVILNKDNCLNQKDGFLSFTVKCELEIKNLENKPVELNPKFKCYKLSDRVGEIIESGLDAIPSQESRKFDVTYDNDGREWSCEIVDFNVRNFN